MVISFVIALGVCPTIFPGSGGSFTDTFVIPAAVPLSIMFYGFLTHPSGMSASSVGESLPLLVLPIILVAAIVFLLWAGIETLVRKNEKQAT